MLRSALAPALAPALAVGLGAACFVDHGAALTSGATDAGTATDTGASVSASTTATTTAAATTTASTAEATSAATTSAASDATSTATSTAATSTSTTTGGETGSTTGPAGPLLCGLPHDGWTLTPPQQLEVLGSSAQESDPRLLPGDLRLVFSSQRIGKGDLYLSARASVDAPWETPILADALGVNTEYGELQAVLTEDELAIALTSNRPGGAGGYDIWFGGRATVEEPFGALIPGGAVLNSSKNEFDLHVTSDAARLYFNAQTDTSAVILVADRLGQGLTWSDPTPVAGVAAPGSKDAAPFLTPDERLIFFASDRGGSMDIWWATRDAPDLPFAAPTLAPTINDEVAFDGEPALSHDGCELIFCSNRLSGTANWEIYTSRVVAP